MYETCSEAKLWCHLLCETSSDSCPAQGPLDPGTGERATTAQYAEVKTRPLARRGGDERRRPCAHRGDQLHVRTEHCERLSEETVVVPSLLDGAAMHPGHSQSLKPPLLVR